MLRQSLFLATTFILLSACNTNKDLIMQSSASSPAAAALLKSTIEAHGGNKYEMAHYAFVFRNKTYTFHNNKGGYNYTLGYEKEGIVYNDQMTNTEFSRRQNGTEMQLTERQRNGYREGLNSVIYFATLPHKLNDPAVNLNHKGTTQIKNQSYQVLEVTFDQEGGGKDFEDTYYYWINDSTKLIDFLAYNYKVNGGGVRFRAAYNPRRVEGILFQDYVNYKAAVGTPLAELPTLWERSELKELSRIETEKVKAL